MSWLTHEEHTDYIILLFPHNSMLFQGGCTFASLCRRYLKNTCCFSCCTAAAYPFCKCSDTCHLGATLLYASIYSLLCKLQVHSPCCFLVHSPQSLGSCIILGAPSSFPLSSSLHYPSHSPVLLKSTAIKTDAGLKCHKCISNCQDINLFTFRCLAVLRARGVGWNREGVERAGAEEEDVAIGR